VEKYRSGLDYKKISETLNIPRCTIKCVIRKEKEYGTTSNLPREGINQRGNKGNPEGAAKLHREIGVSVHRTTLSRTLHRAGLYGRVARKKAIA
jgi:transposase